MKYVKFLMSLLVSTAVILQFGGCSLAGLGIGAIIDSNAEPEQHAVYDTEFNDIEPGDSLTITLRDGGIITGEFIAFTDMKEDDYAALYNQSCKDMFLPFPGLGDTIAINSGFSNMYSFNYIFKGFDYCGMRLKELAGTESENYSLNDIKFIVFRFNNNNRIVQKDIINNFLVARKLPLLSNVNIRNESGDFEISGNEIENVVFIPDSDAWLTGLVVGGVIDFAIIMKLLVDGLGIKFPEHLF